MSPRAGERNETSSSMHTAHDNKQEIETRQAETESKLKDLFRGLG